MTDVLILGNGISRINFHNFILSWPGEVWGCNKAYLDYPEKLTRLTGHQEVLIDAAKYRDEYKLLFEIWGGHLGRCDAVDKKFTCHQRFCRDSGTTLIAQALHEGFNIAVCGFDLGGPDIHSPELENVNKFNWVQRWRKLIEIYGAERISFIGHDHLPFLMSEEQPEAYGKLYNRGKPHIQDTDYLKVWEKWKGEKHESQV